MRIHAVLVLLPLFLGVTLDSQAQYKKRYNRHGSEMEIRYGLKIGFHLSNFTGDEFLSETNSDGRPISIPVDYNFLSSYHAGGYMDIEFSEYFSLQPELYIGTFGTQMNRKVDLSNPGDNFIETPASDPFTTIDIPIQQRLLMLQLPIVAKVTLSQGLALNVGPVVTLKRAEEDRFGDVEDNVLATLGLVDPLAPDKYQNLSYGALLGLSYQLENGFNTSLRYSRTLNNINKNERLGLLAEEPKNSLATFLFAIGYTFNYQEGARKKVRLSN